MHSVRSLWLCFVILTSWSQAISAQPRYLPFTKAPLSQEAYAKAIESNDSKVLNATATEFVDAVARLHPQLEISSAGELAEYIRYLAVMECPQTKAVLGRIDTKLKTVDLDGRERLLREGEMCLFDNNEGLWIASLSCGNLVVKHLPVFSAMVVEDDGVVEPVSSVMETGSRLIQEIDPTDQTGGDAPKKSWLRRHWWWVTPVAVAAVACGIYCRQTVNQEVNIHLP